jgi:hypothetical protein
MMMSSDLWQTRAVPILQFIASHETELRTLTVGQISEGTGIDPKLVVPELERLIDGGYIPGELKKLMSGGDVRPWRLSSPRLTDIGAQALRMWPTAEHVLDVLATRAEEEPDPEKKSKLRALAEALRSVGTDVLGEVLAAAAKQAAGLP